MDLELDGPLASVRAALMGGFCIYWGFGQVTLISSQSCCPGCVCTRAQHPPVTARLPAPALPRLCGHSQTQMSAFLL